MTIKLGKDREVKISSWDLTKVLSIVTVVTAAITKASKYKHKYGSNKKDT